MSQNNPHVVPPWISNTTNPSPVNSTAAAVPSSGAYNPAAAAAAANPPSAMSAGYAKFYAQGPQAVGKRNKRQQGYIQHQNQYHQYQQYGGGYAQPPLLARPPPRPPVGFRGPPPPRPQPPPRMMMMMRPMRPPPAPAGFNHVSNSSLNNNSSSSLNHNSSHHPGMRPRPPMVVPPGHGPQRSSPTKEGLVSHNNSMSSESMPKPKTPIKDWPPSLQQFVNNVFQQCATEEEKTRAGLILRPMIAAAVSDGTLYTRNWNTLPLPVVSTGLLNKTVPLVNLESNQQHPFMSQSKKKRVSMIEHPAFETPEERQKKKQRQERFQHLQSSSPRGVSSSSSGLDEGFSTAVLNEWGELDLEAMTIKGTSDVIEKEYLRLTSPPHPHTVRPESVLRQALKMVKKKRKTGTCDYEYACSQFKSMRQDLTVQRIKNEFTVKVYETHARVALAEGDLNEFNQCQTQLCELYQAGLGSQRSNVEFTAYRVLYCVFTQDQQSNPAMARIEMNTILAQLRTNETITEAEVQHALATREAVAMKDYVQFFKLLAGAPNAGSRAIMNRIAPRIRLEALRMICATFRPSIPIRVLCRLVGLDASSSSTSCSSSSKATRKSNVDDENDDEQTWRLLLEESGLVLLDEDTIDTKSSSIVATLSKTSLI